MRKSVVFAGMVVLAAAAVAAPFVRGSVAAGAAFPRMDMPYANAWAKDIDFGEAVDDHAGALGDVGPGALAISLGYGVSLGDYFRFDAAVANVKYEVSATYTGVDNGAGYSRDVSLTAHIIPVRFDGMFMTPPLLSGNLKPSMGLGVVAFIADYATYHKVTLTPQMGPAVTETGNAWARDVAFGPEIRLGAEYMVLGDLAVELYGTYYAAEASLFNWTETGDIPLDGPFREDFTGWAVWLGPRYYL